MRVFLTDLNMPQEMAERLVAALPPSQAARAKSLGATVGFLLVRYALRQTALEAAELPWQIREGGKPCLPAGAPYFNLSHSDHGVAVVLSDREEVGVDLEEIRPHALRLAERYYSKTEQAAVSTAQDPQSELIRIWSAKEAEAKRLGTGLGNRIAEIPIDGVAAICVELDGKPHWLTVSPATQMPHIEWITADLLLP